MNMPEIHEINWKPVIKRWKKDGRKMGTFSGVTGEEEESASKVVRVILLNIQIVKKYWGGMCKGVRDAYA